MADVPGLKCLVFDGERIEAALRAHFPMMDAAALRDMVVVASEIGDALWHAREARIAKYGETWRPHDAFAEAIACIFTLESMSQSDATTGRTLAVISHVIHQVYAHVDEVQGPPSPPPDGPPGSGGFEN
jgi:hypothetical protein